MTFRTDTVTVSSFDVDDADPPEPPEGCGCCSAYAFPPLVILIIAAAVSAITFRNPDGLPGPVSRVHARLLPSPISGIFTPEVQFWGRSISTWATDAGLDPNLAAVVMQIESCGDPRALSRAGAMGLFQVMPFHFAAFEEPYAPATNAARGLAYLARSLNSAHGDARLALAGYNGGVAVIAWPEWAWSAETRRYAYWGGGIYADVRSGASSSPRLEEWLAAGGASLCVRARQSLQFTE
jgi:hypothetical protein